MSPEDEPPAEEEQWDDWDASSQPPAGEPLAFADLYAAAEVKPVVLEVPVKKSEYEALGNKNKVERLAKALAEKLSEDDDQAV